jgi:GDP-4-dehydro-6-deoxy-D-mannose reductase
MAAQVAAIAAGKQEPVISVGDIDVTRDFTDVRDVVSAYARLLVSGVSGRTYLIGSGVERSVRDILSQLLRLRGVSAEIVRDASKFRPAEQRRMVADCRLTEIETGWVPRIQWDQTLKDILEELEKQV